ncbi:uncharacterized protein LOC132613068 [Lycium barbarum]|uniref:uncharacterized protein LOC132613068 n=1 Tax=Lycium barbarum TaxID=112863 RepID=UPI00293E1521|nr:uncharacterized protein LOC132613068 [Lycium barbarum]
MDPQEHVTSYTCAIKGNDLKDDEIESVLLKNFSETLSKGAMTWYSMLPEHSINSFEMLADTFFKGHARARKVQARKADIFWIAQKDNELLREFVSRFQKEQMLSPPVPEEWAAQAFTKGKIPRSSATSFKLKENLLEYEAVTWADVHNKYESKIRVEVDQLKLPPAIGHIKDMRWTRPLRFDPAQIDPNVVCEYHDTHGHRTEDCRQLRDEVDRLLKNGHLHEFLSIEKKEITKAGKRISRLNQWNLNT